MRLAPLVDSLTPLLHPHFAAALASIHSLLLSVLSDAVRCCWLLHRPLKHSVSVFESWHGKKCRPLFNGGAPDRRRHTIPPPLHHPHHPSRQQPSRLLLRLCRFRHSCSSPEPRPGPRDASWSARDCATWMPLSWRRRPGDNPSDPAFWCSKRRRPVGVAPAAAMPMPLPAGPSSLTLLCDIGALKYELGRETVSWTHKHSDWVGCAVCLVLLLLLLCIVRFRGMNVIRVRSFL